MKQVTYDKELIKKKKVKSIKEQDVFVCDLPLMTDDGSFIINGTARVVVSQLHRSPGAFFEHDKGKTHPTGKTLLNARIIPNRGAWLDFEFDIKGCLFARIDRRRKMPISVVLRAMEMSTEEILTHFYDFNEFNVQGNDIVFTLEPEQLRGQLARFDICDNDGKVIVEQDQRILGKHIKAMKKAKLKTLVVNDAFLIGRVIAQAVIDPETGEELIPSNTIIDEAVVEILRNGSIEAFTTIYTNEFDRVLTSLIPCYRFILFNLDALVEIYR